MWSNCLYAFGKLRQKESAGALAVCGCSVGLGVLLPFLETALAGAVTAILVSGKRPGEILLMVGGYVALLQIARFLWGHMYDLRYDKLFLLRTEYGDGSSSGRPYGWTDRAWRAPRDRRSGIMPCGTCTREMMRE